MTRIVSVFGGSAPRPGSPAYAQAQALGAALAEGGWTVATGGYSGVMEAASRGAAEAGGHVIGVTCELIEAWRNLRANAWVNEETRFPTLRERLYHLVTFCDAAVALPGGIGTLSEVALTWSLLQTGEMARKPFVVVGRLWGETVSTFASQAGEYIHPGDRELVTIVDDVAAVLPALNGSRDEAR